MTTYEEILQSMEEKYQALTGFSPDSASDIGIRLKVLAQRIWEFYQELADLKNQVFPQTSSGGHLELHAQTRGITRKSPLPALGALRFSRETPAISDITIGAGIICSTRPDPQVQFETVEGGVLAAGETCVEITARAVDLGVQGNVAPGSVCLMVTPAPGISTVTNPDSFVGGVDGERDEELRERLLQSYRNISNGTNSAFYYDLAMGQEGVASVNVLPRNRGRGTVDVIITCHAPAGEAAAVAALQEELERRKEINVDVLVEAARRDGADIRVEVSIPDGYQPEVVLERCQRCIQAFVAGLGVGAPLLLSQLGSAIIGVDGVYNYRILEPGGDVSPLQNHVVEARDISVVRMAVG